MGAFVYILRCRDGSYSVGSTRAALDRRVTEHNAGTYGGYTTKRRPVTLAYAQQFANITDAIAAERQVKGWRREKKEALIRGDLAALPALASRVRRPKQSSSFETRPQTAAPQDEGFSFGEEPSGASLEG